MFFYFLLQVECNRIEVHERMKRRCVADLSVSLLQELTSHMKPKGRTTQPTQTRPSSMRRGDTTTQTRRRSTISKLDRPGETGGDAGCGGAVGALWLTPIGYVKAWGRGG